MRRNNKALYEQIMRNVAREVKRALNESQEPGLPIIRTADDVDQLDRNDFRRSSSYSKSIRFCIDLSYIFPDGNWDDPIVPVTFEYFFSSRGMDNNYSEIYAECPEETLEAEGYFMEDLDDYLYDNQGTWLYDFLDLSR